MFAQLGDHVFQGLNAPHSWSEASAARYGKISLVNGKDILQFTGEDLSNIDLSIRYSIEFCDPSAEIAALKKSMKRAEILPFISGEGAVFGNFVISGIDITNEMFSPTGLLEAAAVSLKLVEYAYGKKVKVNKKTNAAAAPVVTVASPVESEVTGEALVSADPVAEPPTPPVESPAAEIAKDLSKAEKMVQKIKKTAADVKKGITTAKQAVRAVRKLANDVKQVYTSVKSKIDNTIKIIERAKNLPTSLDEVIGYAENLSKIDNVADISVLQANVTSLSESCDKVKDASANVVAFAATKEDGK
jgi:phage protein U